LSPRRRGGAHGTRKYRGKQRKLLGERRSMRENKITWETEGDQINPEIANVILYRSPQITSFLDPHNKHFIVAGKGLGKTLILKTKRFLLEKKEADHSGSSPIAFVPSDNPYLDSPINFGTLDISKRNILSDHEMAMKIWEFSIQLSAITVFIYRTKRHYNEELVKLLPTFIIVHIKNHRELSPCSVLGLLLQNTVSDINRIIDVHSADVCINYHDVHMPIYMFIDQIDQAFLGYEGKMWYSMQTGLMEAAWSCMRSNHHIRIYASLRIEAYKNHVSPNRQALIGAVTKLVYSKSDLEMILETLSDFYEKKGFHDFIGFVDFINPVTGKNEKALDYIYRHTTGTPRNLVCIVSKLNETKKKQTVLDITSFRETVNISSNEEIGTAIITENTIFLKALRMPAERERFFSLLHRNILYRDELKVICKEFNEIGDFPEDCEDCSSCENSHPFCELNNIGLLGNVQEKEDVRFQTFVNPHELKGNLQNSMSRNSQIYMLHPSLTGHIRDVRDHRLGLPFAMVKGITVFNTYSWDDTDDAMLELQIKLEKMKITKRARQALNTMFANVYKKDISISIEKFNDKLNLKITQLEETLKTHKTANNEAKLKLGKKQKIQIQKITTSLLKINNVQRQL